MKTIFYLLFLFCCSLILRAQSIDKAYEFPIKPGTKAWENLKNHAEKVNACQIPDSILELISTEELIDICLDYPLFPDIMAFNSVQDGINHLKQNFNGIRELIARDDYPQILLSKYKLISPLEYDKGWTLIEKGRYSFEITSIELLLSQNEVINKMSKEDKKDVVKILLKKDKEKSESEIYGSISHMSNVYAISRIIYSDKFEEFDSDSTYHFSRNGYLNETKHYTVIKEKANKYLND